MRKSLALSKRSESNGFTLVELLIVMGVLAVVVVTILVTLNPSEAGKKSRDVKRMKDLATLEAIVLQWLQDGKEPFCTSYCRSFPAGRVSSQPCATPNWLGVNLCDYTKTVPVSPRNSEAVTVINGGTVQNPIMGNPFGTDGMHYVLIMSGSDYKIRSRLESASNADKVFNDGNSHPDYEVFSNNGQGL